MKLAEFSGGLPNPVTVPLASVDGTVFNTAHNSALFHLLTNGHSAATRPLIITALLLHSLGLSTPRTPANKNQWPHLQRINLADPLFTKPGEIDLLLGAETYARIMRNGVCRGPDGTPTAQNSSLGWLVFGGSASVTPATLCTTTAATDSSITRLLERFWNLEEASAPCQLSNADKDCERRFEQGCRREPSGRYVVRLPVKLPGLLPANGTLAAARRALRRAQARMKTDPEFAHLYCTFMREYESLSHMRPVPVEAPPPEDPGVSYLPHHAVWQGTARGRKLRVVFNASCRVGQGPSLNDCLHPGPPLQADLVIIICLWRLFRVAVGADFEKMYRHILLDPEDVNLQRIVWQEPGGVETHFQLLTVTYGINCAPYLALRVLKKLAQDEAQRCPGAARLLEDHTYVDDVLFGADDVPTARQLRDELIGLTAAGGFRMYKWTSSHPHVIIDVPQNARLRPEWKEFTPDDPIKTLGIFWDPSNDEFRYRVPSHTRPQGY